MKKRHKCPHCQGPIYLQLSKASPLIEGPGDYPRKIDREELLKLWDEGASVKALAKHFSCSKQAIHQHLNSRILRTV